MRFTKRDAFSDRHNVLSLTVYDWDVSSTLAAGTIVDDVKIVGDQSQSSSHALCTYQYQWEVPRRAFGEHDVAKFGVIFVMVQRVPECSKSLGIKDLGYVIPRGGMTCQIARFC